MTIYEVVNEQNYPVYAFLTRRNAEREVEALNEGRDDPCFYIKVLEMEDIE